MKRKDKICIPGIYMLRSKTDKEIFYIGGTDNLSRARSRHSKLTSNQTYYNIKSHMRQYGICDLEFIVVEKCKSEELYIKEQYYISELNPTLNINRMATNNHDKLSDFAKNTFISDFKKEDNYKCRKISPFEEHIVRALNEMIPEIIIPLNII
jgi:group I intron endonuclease